MDQVFLDLALSASVEVLVSGDADLLALQDQRQGPWARPSPKFCLIPRLQVLAGGSVELEAFLLR